VRACSTAIALVGSVTLLLHARTLQRLLLPLVALAAGSMIGGALFHMLPAGVAALESELLAHVWVAVGFVLFLVLELLLSRLHCQRPDCPPHKPVGHLILIGDSIHNFTEGLVVGGAFVIDTKLGISTWLVAAAHEIPQELGDFGVLLHAGWRRSRALLLNLLSGLAFVLGGVCAYAASLRFDVDFLIPLAAGSFLYVGASDLVPELVQRGRVGETLVRLTAFVVGLGLLLALRVYLE
ncbi:MAG TPA: ZIP family metal transporter, partial [Enhygromyxa sp.]|nr:ZIP family metal transporter [Enhygromyxa sp.]